ncbi:MAG TPA: TonB-dependent receptor, partial [Flavobacteriales bacterium]
NRSTVLRTIEEYDDDTPGEQFDRKGEQRVSRITSGWNALGNLSFKLDRNNTFSLMAMGNVQGENNARYLLFLAPSVSDATFVSEEQYWEQRRLWTFQYGSKHLIPAFNLTVTPDLSFSNGERDLLDLKVVQYILPPPGQTIADVDGALRPPGRIFRFLNEQVADARLGFELPLSDDREKVSKLKFGGAYRWNERTNDQRYFVVQGAPGPTQWETPGRFDMQADGRFQSSYVPFGSFKDDDIGILKVMAGFVMTDHSITKRVRVAGGIRMEHTDLISDIRKYHEEGVAADDPQRGTVGDIGIIGANGAEPKPAVPGTIDQWDVLPSVNFIWKLRPEEKQAMNLRLGYFRSLSRPSFREFSVVQYYDYQLQAPVYGNPDLRMTAVDNADIRLERFLKNGDNVSVSGFYKAFRDHIELLQTSQGGFTWRNADRSQVIGLELEGRFKLLRALEWRGNLTLMESRSELTTELNGERVDYTTPMFGQSPYIINSTLNYGLDSARMDISVSYNVQGPKLAVTNSELDPEGIRAFEMPRHLIDITLNKRFGKHWGVMFRVRDLLNAPQRRSYRFASGYDADFNSYAFGTEYRLTLSWTIR